jgi:septal ring factor EnvC (AmiA/AmiB activator)
MEEEDIEECIKKVNAIDNGVMLFAQNMSQKFESIKNLKKKYVDKLVDYKVFIGGDPSKEEKEKNFRDVEALARDFKNAIKSIWTFDEGSKRFIETIDKENESLMGQINSYKNTLKDIEKYIKNNPKKKEESKKDDNKDEKKDETKKDEEEKKDETKKRRKKKRRR